LPDARTQPYAERWRFSISNSMAVVALAAANCAALRAVLPARGNWDGCGLYFVGLLPLLNAQIIGLYLIAARYRISMRRRRGQDRVGAVPTLVAANALALVAGA
jgi:hypothetical protein